MKSTDSYNHLQNQRGFSMVELMIALTIGLLILASVGVIFVNTKKSYGTQDRLSRLQENGRFAMHYLMRDLRLVGYMGCLSDMTDFKNRLNDNTLFSFNLSVPIEGFDSSGAAWSPSGDTNKPGLAGTDMVAIRFVDPSASTTIITPMPNTSAELIVSSTASFSDGDFMLISDCATADLMQITQVQPESAKIQHNPGESVSPGNASQLEKTYDTNAKVFKFTTRRYYLKNNPNGVPSLYMDTNGTSEMELVEGIETMQVTYGIDTDNDLQPNQYLKAGDAGLQSAAEWAKVVSVRVGILARTLNSADTDNDTNTYDVNDQTIGPLNDRVQRRTFTSTVLLRNLTRQ
jgi:type IV pilus assembly protein PilW